MTKYIPHVLVLTCLVAVLLTIRSGDYRKVDTTDQTGLSSAPFVQRDLPGMRPYTPLDPSYSPSSAIVSAATLHTTGNGTFERSWYELVPTDGPPKAIVVLLHGAGRNGLSVLEMWEATARRHGLLLVAPNATGETWSHNVVDRDFITEAARDAAVTHGLVPDGMFLFGHSDGAAMAQEVLNKAEPGVWSAAAVHGGYVAASRLSAAKTNAPFRMYLGNQDHIFSIEAARKSGEAMAYRGHPTELLIIPGHTHWFYEIGPRIAENAWTWFASR